jgi:cysteine desulfurase
MNHPIYMDYAATTPIDGRVAKLMSRYMDIEGVFGNPASRTHEFGWQAEEAVENARVQVAKVLNADPREIVWTSGATESDNLAIKGLAEKTDKNHIITSKIEHKAVLDTCHFLEEKGFNVTYLQPDSKGCCSADQVERALTDETFIVSLMHVNNELGAINDIAKIGKVCSNRDVVFHVDAAQSFGKIPIDVRALGIDMISISAHKIYGPKGIGVLFVNRESNIGLQPMIHGGGHEFGMRSGTLATHQIVGIGEASELMYLEGRKDFDSHLRFREILFSSLNQIPDIHINSDLETSIPSIINVSFADVNGETLMSALDNVALSSGSACNSELVEPSYVLKGIGLSNELADSALRFSFGRYTLEEEVQAVGKQVAKVVGALRSS